MSRVLTQHVQLFSTNPPLKDTLKAETSDVGLDEVQVLVSVVMLLLQCANGVTLMTDKQVRQR